MSEQISKFLIEPRIDNEKADKQKDELKYYLTEGETGPNKFIVINNETGFGKSRATDGFIAKSDSRKYILVKKYNDAKTDSLKSMREQLSDSVWGDFSDWDGALIINADNSNSYETIFIDKLLSAKILIISHEKYRLLGSSGKLSLYTSGRQTLIIDESVDVPIFSISSKYFEKYRVLFSYDLGTFQFNRLQEFFNQLFKNINNREDSDETVLKRANMSLVEFKVNSNSKEALENIKHLEKLYQEKWYEIMQASKNHTIDRNPITIMDYYKFFSEINSILKNQSIYSSYYKALFTYRKFDFWTLDNNIILDASGDILTQYKLNPMFELIKKEKIFDYRDTTIHIKKSKSNKSEIDKRFKAEVVDGGSLNGSSTESYINAIAKYVVKNHDYSVDQTLVINFKDHSEIFDGQLIRLMPVNNVKTAWHGNILGKNDWRNCNKIFINSMYNLPEPNYILMYSFYKGKRIKTGDLVVEVSNHARKYMNKTIEDLKQNYILHNLYQEIKRINRKVDMVSDVYIIIDNKHFLKNIQNLMQNVNLIEDYDIQLPEKTNIFETRLDYINMKAELERMTTADPKNRKEFSKQLFCSNTGIDSKRLKERLYVEYIKKLCDTYGLDYKNTFKQNSKQLYFKKRKK